MGHNYEGGYRSTGVAVATTSPATAPANLLNTEVNGRAIEIKATVEARIQSQKDGPDTVTRKCIRVVGCNGVTNATAQNFPCGEPWRS